MGLLFVLGVSWCAEPFFYNCKASRSTPFLSDLCGWLLFFLACRIRGPPLSRSPAAEPRSTPVPAPAGLVPPFFSPSTTLQFSGHSRFPPRGRCRPALKSFVIDPPREGNPPPEFQRSSDPNSNVPRSLFQNALASFLPSIRLNDLSPLFRPEMLSRLKTLSFFEFLGFQLNWSHRLIQ